jgi:hypothetical protein
MAQRKVVALLQLTSAAFASLFIQDDLTGGRQKTAGSQQKGVPYLMERCVDLYLA